MAKQPVVPKENTPEAAEPPFEQRLAELEGVVKQLESAELPLEKAIEIFEKGIRLSESCRKELEAAETRVEILMKRGGGVQSEPFETDEQD